MRIGTNHGSLSARILSFYGDSPRGMVESAVEFADICRSLDYHNFVFSMKASNPVVMIQVTSATPERQPSVSAAPKPAPPRHRQPTPPPSPRDRATDCSRRRCTGSAGTTRSTSA